MASYRFSPSPVLIETTGELAVGATGIFRSPEDNGEVQVYDLNDSPLNRIVVGPRGAHQAFKADIPHGTLDFGSTLVLKVCDEAIAAVITVQSTAESALAQVETMQTSKAPIIHTHDVDDLVATGAPSDTTFLRGDGAWAVPAGSGAGGGGLGFIDGGTPDSTFSDTVIDGGAP